MVSLFFQGIKLVFVLDGNSPEEKRRVWLRRKRKQQGLIEVIDGFSAESSSFRGIIFLQGLFDDLYSRLEDLDFTHGFDVRILPWSKVNCGRDT